jgi:hypothetical protein
VRGGWVGVEGEMTQTMYVHMNIWIKKKFAFPTDTASAQAIICGLTQWLTYPHGILHRIVTDQGTPLPSNNLWQQLVLMEFTILPCSLPSWIQEWTFENSNSWASILTPVILAPQQAELRKTEVQRIARPILC